MTLSIDTAVDAFEPTLPLGVAFSGGADSTALLLACARRWPGQVLALHVNHNLQEAAAQFEKHCRAVCLALEVPLEIRSVNASPLRGDSPENAARTARYLALHSMAQDGLDGHPIKTIALAQHADDQVETVLLALCRGGGLAGLSGMAPQWEEGGIRYARPLLHVHRETILQWLALQDVAYVDDPMNEDESLTRSALRARVLPAIERIYPQFRTTIARSAGNAAQVQTLLDEVAQQDLQSVCIGLHGVPQIKALQQFSDARLSNTLRYWLKAQFLAIPSQAQLCELIRLVRACTTRGHQIHLKVANGFVERRGAGLTWYNPQVLRTEN